MRFATGGTQDEIDLNNKHATAFRKQLAPFVEHSARPGEDSATRVPPQAGSAAATSGPWAKEHGIAVSGRGRIPARVAEQYEATTRGS